MIKPANIKIAILLATSFCALSVNSARADENACEGICPEGQKTIAHADGENTTCYCSGSSNGMEATVPDTSAVNNEPDPGQSEITDASSVVPSEEFAPDPNIN